MLRGYGAEILIPRDVHARPLLSSSQPRLLIPSAAEKHTKSSLVSEPCPTLLPRSGMLYHKQSGKQTPFLWMTLYHVSFSSSCLWLSLYPPSPPFWAFKLMETSYKARHHHHHHQLKATKQSISVRQPSTTPCSHGSWDRLNWDGGGGGRSGLPITPTHPASWWWREGLHTSSPSESVIFSNRL